MNKVILDCDNTMSVLRSDVDDGLTFMYLYQHPGVDLLGVTTTFANNKLHVVYDNTLQMLKDLNINDVKVLRGARTNEQLESEAADFLVEQADKYPGEIVVIAIGSLQNIYCAYLKDNDFFNKIKRLILMGGVTEPLYINGVHCRELNFSCAHVAAYNVLKYGKNISILSSQTTLQAWFGKEEINRIASKNNKLSKYLMPILKEWIDYIGARFKENGFHNWDLVTAIYLTNPELFETVDYRISLSEENLKEGFIPEDIEGNAEEYAIIDHPTKILDLDRFNDLFHKMLDGLAEKME